MDDNGTTRRDFLRTAAPRAARVIFASKPDKDRAPNHRPGGWVPDPMRIGVIGAHPVARAVGVHWALAGHEVLFASVPPEEERALFAEAGSLARIGNYAEAATFSEILLVALPTEEVEEFVRAHGAAAAGKVAIDCWSPAVDGGAGEDGMRAPSGVPPVPGPRWVRAFQAVSACQVEEEAHRPGERFPVSVSGDDPSAVRLVSVLVVDAGFEPVF